MVNTTSIYRIQIIYIVADYMGGISHLNKDYKVTILRNYNSNIHCHAKKKYIYKNES
jgi:hypothetical protein